jgi:hypothetical protein
MYVVNLINYIKLKEENVNVYIIDYINANKESTFRI